MPKNRDGGLSLGQAAVTHTRNNSFFLGKGSLGEIGRGSFQGVHGMKNLRSF